MWQNEWSLFMEINGVLRRRVRWWQHAARAPRRSNLHVIFARCSTQIVLMVRAETEISAFQFGWAHISSRRKWKPGQRSLGNLIPPAVLRPALVPSEPAGPTPTMPFSRPRAGPGRAGPKPDRRRRRRPVPRNPKFLLRVLIMIRAPAKTSPGGESRFLSLSPSFPSFCGEPNNATFSP